MKRFASSAALVVAGLAALASGCGPDGETFTLRIYNPGDTAVGDHSQDGFATTENAYAIDELLHHPCDADGGSTTFDPVADVTAGEDGKPVLIPPHQSYNLLLPPGCHDLRVHQVTSGNEHYEQARVIGRYGETLTWRTFRVFWKDDLK